MNDSARKGNSQNQRAPDRDSPGTASIVYVLERLSQVIRLLLWQKTRDHGLSPVQVQALLWLSSRPSGGGRPGELARELSLSPATVSEVVATLENKGLVTRRRDPRDRRARLLSPSAKGRRLAGRLGDWSLPLELALAGVDGSLRIQGAAFLLQLLGELQRAGVLATSRLCLTCEHCERRGPADGSAAYRCRLTGRSFAADGIKVDCPEHVPSTQPLDERF